MSCWPASARPLHQGPARAPLLTSRHRAAAVASMSSTGLQDRCRASTGAGNGLQSKKTWRGRWVEILRPAIVEPISRTSLGQSAPAAGLKDGQAVAVKVQRPGPARRQSRLDLYNSCANNRQLAEYANVQPDPQRPVALIDELGMRVSRVDYLHKAEEMPKPRKASTSTSPHRPCRPSTQLKATSRRC